MRFLFLFLFPFFAFANCSFTPPPNWEVADAKTAAKRHIIGFIDTSRTGFRPSINLTSEALEISPQEYLKIVQKNSEGKNQKWRHIGKLETISGPAELIEIEVETKFGPARLLQLILFKEKTAYILTAGTLKKEFGKYAELLQTSMKSLKVVQKEAKS